MRGLPVNLPNLCFRGDLSFIITYWRAPELCFALEGDVISIFQVAWYTNIFEKIVQNKAVLRHAKTEGSVENCLSTILTPFYILLTSGKFSHKYATVLVTLINLTDRGWDQIHLICLMWHLIESNTKSSPSSMTKPVCNVDLSHAS